ncbi:MAG: glycosyltransferase family 9 protein [Pseudanabaena sp. RU_4_16]|nr:glycosyltransferase family 9 protein [Pseudanabaena sp. RU_4_16]
MNLGLALLISGNYAEGLAEYEWRSQRSSLDKSSPHFFPHPLWDGNDLQGRTLLVFGEQGFGDLIQFIRYIPQIKARAGQNCKLIFDCQSSLNRLFSNICGLHLAPRNMPLPKFDVRISLLSLPYLLGTTLETIPATVPYLSVAEDINLGAIQKISDRQAQLKVGLVWTSKQTHSTAPKRSCHLTSLLPLFDLQDIHFYGLQKEVSDADRQLISQQHLKLTDLSDYLGDFADTAAIVNHLDLIITVDTSVAHLAGALGKPVWVLLPFAPDWRWLLDCEDSPWYPTMRLFRQTQIDNWESAIDRVAVALSSLVARDDVNIDVMVFPQMEELCQSVAEVPNLDKLFTEARAHHLAGELKEAETLFQGYFSINRSTMKLGIC